MKEVALVAGIVALSWASRLVPILHRNNMTWVLGACALMLGVMGSFVAGMGYHWALYRALGPRGALPRGWWWSPTRLHPMLRGSERNAVMPWFYAGAASFVLVVLGAIAVLGVALG